MNGNAMTAATSFLLACLAVWNARLARSLFYPPAVFAAFWAALLLLLVLCGDHFYSLLESSLFVFVLGAVCFSGGGLLGLAIPQKRRQPLSNAHRALVWLILDIGLAAMIVVFPFYLGRLGAIIDNCRLALDPVVALRYEATIAERGIFEGYAYAISIFTFLTLVAWCECDGSLRQRARCWLMAGLTLAYHLSSVSRRGALLFVFCLLWVIFLRKRKVSFPAILSVSLAVAAIYAGAAIFLGKGGHRDAGFAENVAGVFNAFLTYLLAGLVAFNDVVCNPAVIEQELFAFFQSVANVFGADYYVCRCQSRFAVTPELTNTYTLYMSPYAEYGFCGVIVYLLLLGIACAWIFRAWKLGAPWAAVLYACVAGNLLLTGAVDPFLRSLSVWAQLAIMAWGIYELPKLLFTSRSWVATQHGHRQFLPRSLSGN